jgi:hypothetical protein
MSVTKWERGNSFKTSVEWLSGSSTYIDPSSNISTLYVYKPDNTLYFSHSGVRDGTGLYHYYVSTTSDDLLGLWRLKWSALFTYEEPFSYLEKTDTEVIEMVEVIQS